MKKFIILVIFAAIVCFITGCGPGEPFQIEDSCKIPVHEVAG